MLAIPKRVVTKPDWMSVARLTSGTGDFSAVGDRVLAMFIGRGFYQFSTYNLARNINMQPFNIDYGRSLEGVWNFVYVCYSGPASTALAWARFGDDNRVVRAMVSEVRHELLPGHATFTMGKEFRYMGFNGLVKGLIVRFDRTAYISSEDDLVALTESVNRKPELVNIDERRIEVQAEESGEVVNQEWAEDHA